MTTSPFGPMHVVVNPRAGRRAVEQGWPQVQAVLDRARLAYEVTFTTAPRHAEQIAREALGRGVRYVVAVGGDGTVNEVVNGMMGEDAPVHPDAVLGIVAAGSGCDFARTFGLPDDAAAAAEHLVGDRLWGKLDVGRVRCADGGGAPTSRWFVNVAEAGIGADVVVRASRMPRWLGGRAYRLAALAAIATYKPREATARMRNGRKSRARVGSPLGALEHRGTVTMVVVANCQFFGGGLRVAPRAIPSDAMLDVLIGEGTKWEALKALQKMPTGSHVPDRTIAEYLAEDVTLEAPVPLSIEVDGEPVGVTPARFDLVPDALALKI